MRFRQETCMCSQRTRSGSAWSRVQYSALFVPRHSHPRQLRDRTPEGPPRNYVPVRAMLCLSALAASCLTLRAPLQAPLRAPHLPRRATPPSRQLRFRTIETATTSVTSPRRRLERRRCRPDRASPRATRLRASRTRNARIAPASSVLACKVSRPSNSLPSR
jgi:hypothetical protein